MFRVIGKSRKERSAQSANNLKSHKPESEPVAAYMSSKAERGAPSDKKKYETVRRNVFKDIGVPNAEEHLVKAQLVFKIGTIMKDRGLKQVEAADLFGVRQPDVSKMLRGEFRQFSVERLVRFLVALDQNVKDRRKAAPRHEECCGVASFLKR